MTAAEKEATACQMLKRSPQKATNQGLSKNALTTLWNRSDALKSMALSGAARHGLHKLGVQA